MARLLIVLMLIVLTAMTAQAQIHYNPADFIKPEDIDRAFSSPDELIAFLNRATLGLFVPITQLLILVTAASRSKNPTYFAVLYLIFITVNYSVFGFGSDTLITIIGGLAIAGIAWQVFWRRRPW